MPNPASAVTWIAAITALIGLVAAALKLVTDIRQARRKPQPPLPPVSADAASAPQSPMEEPRIQIPDDPRLPGRPPFTNRRREVSDLVARVHSGRDNLLAIEGAPLVGKSATARELMYCLRSGPVEDTFDPRERRFVWFDARDTCPTLADICGHLALETDEQSLSAAAEADKREELRLHLGRSKIVLVLDDLNLSDDSQSQVLIDFLEDLPGNALVIATVNRPGALVAPRVQLGDFDPDDVKDLIEDQAKRFDLDGMEQFNEEFAHRLHGLIGGNPGVIEWFLRVYHDTSQPLEERVAALRENGELSELFKPTWETLSDDCKAALEACAHLDGEATTEQMAITCDRPEQEITEAADELRREKLLTAIRGKDRPTFFTCARAFQVFVASITSDQRHAEFTERLADHYIRYFNTNPEDAHYGASQVGAWRVLRNELYEARDDARMQALFWVVLDILFTLGQYDELIDAAFWAFESAREANNLADAALAGAIKAATHAIRGEKDLAQKALANAANAADGSCLPGPISRVMRCRGFVLYRAGQPRQALRAIEGAEETSREGEDLFTLVDTLDLRTAANWHLRRFDACEAAARASLKAGERMGWERARAYPLRYLAELAFRHRRREEAQALLDEAYEIATRFADRRQRARVDLSRARLYLFEGKLDAAVEAVTRAVSEAKRLGLPPERREATAVANAINRARRSWTWRRYYVLRRPTRFTTAPVGGD